MDIDRSHYHVDDKIHILKFRRDITYLCEDSSSKEIFIISNSFTTLRAIDCSSGGDGPAPSLSKPARATRTERS